MAAIIEEKLEFAYACAKRKRTSLIIVHLSDIIAGVHDIHRLHRRAGLSGIACHYYIRQDGAIYRARPENWIGAHAAGYNGVSVGICFEGIFKEQAVTEAQLHAGRGLLADILPRYPGAAVAAYGDFCKVKYPGGGFPMSFLTGLYP